jgi:hypothetical protein
VAKEKPPKKTRFIDSAGIKEKLAKLQMKLLDELEERLNEGVMEPQEERLLWDMIKAHQVGFETVDSMMKKALGDVEENVEDIDIPEDWGFS